MEKVDELEQKISEAKGNEGETQKMVGKLGASGFFGVTVWKIINFSEILREAKTGNKKSVDGVPFYTETFGYKLKVRIYPNGYGTGNNAHLMVFIILMKGEYDAILPWPFKRKVTYTLIDQQDDPVERENVIGQINNGISPNVWKRPIHGEECPGKGIARFISHEKLFSRRYVVDDTLFLQVEVGP